MSFSSFVFLMRFTFVIKLKLWMMNFSLWWCLGPLMVNCNSMFYICSFCYVVLSSSIWWLYLNILSAYYLVMYCRKWLNPMIDIGVLRSLNSCIVDHKINLCTIAYCLQLTYLSMLFHTVYFELCFSWCHKVFMYNIQCSSS